jgi:hypothetical protein
MTIIFEANKPFQLKPGYLKTDIMFRAWWLYFAIAITKKSLHELISGKYEWSYKKNNMNSKTFDYTKNAMDFETWWGINGTHGLATKEQSKIAWDIAMKGNKRYDY